MTYEAMGASSPERCNSLHCGPERATAIYRLYNCDERLLYAGIAYDIEGRWREHSRDKPWWPEVRWKTALWHGTRIGAAAEEYCAIKYENPIYNKRRDSDYRLGVESTAAPGKHEPRESPFWLLTHAIRSPYGAAESETEVDHYAAVISRAGMVGDDRCLWFPQLPALGGSICRPSRCESPFGPPVGTSAREQFALAFHSAAINLIGRHLQVGEEEFTASLHFADGCPDPDFARPVRTWPPKRAVAAPVKPARVTPAAGPSRWKRFWGGFAAAR